MLLLTLRDIRYRLLRFVIVTSVAAVVFALLFLMNGLVEQFHREPVDTTASFRAGGWVLAAGVAGPFTSASTVRTSDAARVHAAERAPVVIARSTLHRRTSAREVILVGHVPGGLGTPVIVQGRSVQASGEVVTDRSLGARVGEDVTLGRARYRVVGLTSNATVLAGIPLTYVDLVGAQDIAFGTRGVVTGFLVRGNVSSIPAEFDVRSSAQVAADTFHLLENAITSIDLVRALLWFVAAVIIGAVVFLSALERRRDFASSRPSGRPTGHLRVAWRSQPSPLRWLACSWRPACNCCCGRRSHSGSGCRPPTTGVCRSWPRSRRSSPPQRRCAASCAPTRPQRSLAQED